MYVTMALALLYGVRGDIVGADLGKNEPKKP